MVTASALKAMRILSAQHVKLDGDIFKMKTLKKLATQGALAACLITGAGASNADVIDLGFVLDRSGSIGSGGYTLITDGLADALALVPTSGPDQYSISVVSFASSASTVVAPTILTAANLAGIQQAIRDDSFSGGTTNIDAGLSLLNTNQQGVGFGDSSLVNISTDGEPNQGTTDPNTTRAAAIAAGWDGISAEAIGSFDLTYLQTLAYPVPVLTTNDPNALPDPLVRGFVLTVDNTDDYAGAIESKIKAIVQVPEPGTLALFSIAAFGLAGAVRRRRA